MQSVAVGPAPSRRGCGSSSPAAGAWPGAADGGRTALRASSTGRPATCPCPGPAAGLFGREGHSLGHTRAQRSDRRRAAGPGARRALCSWPRRSPRPSLRGALVGPSADICRPHGQLAVRAVASGHVRQGARVAGGPARSEATNARCPHDLPQPRCCGLSPGLLNSDQSSPRGCRAVFLTAAGGRAGPLLGGGAVTVCLGCARGSTPGQGTTASSRRTRWPWAQRTLSTVRLCEGRKGKESAREVCAGLKCVLCTACVCVGGGWPQSVALRTGSPRGSEVPTLTRGRQHVSVTRPHRRNTATCSLGSDGDSGLSSSSAENLGCAVPESLLLRRHGQTSPLMPFPLSP